MRRRAFLAALPLLIPGVAEAKHGRHRAHRKKRSKQVTSECLCIGHLCYRTPIRCINVAGTLKCVAKTEACTP